ncbi:hypothetical protein [Streptomyces sp. NPDC002133]|uniref:hypothetical protein n=1 Tax=Streptomyces sp. NPDC002133 TaxID=3154409 RepID=UPI00332EF1BC
MDVEQVIEELYGVLPEEFTAARDARVAEARRAKETAAAKRIAGLRRPTSAAWTSNLFVRRRPKQCEQLLALGETLREAHRTLDPQKFREASGQQHKVIGALAREAAALAEQAGQSVSETVRHEVERIFHAVLASADFAARWSAGSLVKAPEAATDFGALVPELLPSRPAPQAKGTPAASARTTAQKREAERRDKLEHARAVAGEAEAEARHRDEALRAAEEAQRTADARADGAAERVAELERQLRNARQEEQDARTAAAEAGSAASEAGRAAKVAHRAADRAARALGGLG